MKKQLLSIAIAAAVSGYANAYQFELGAAYGQGDLDFGGFSTDFDLTGLYGELHFEKVDTSKGPLAEAAFLDKSSFVDFSYTSVSPDDGDDTDTFGVGGRFVTGSNLIIEANYDSADDGDDDADTFGVGIGTYLNDTTDVVVSYNTTDEDNADLDELAVNLHGVSPLAQGASIAYDLGAALIDADDEDGYGLTAGATYYFNNQFGVGVSVDMVDIDDYEEDTVTLDVTYFVAPNVQLAFSYFDSSADLPGGGSADSDGFLIGVAGRF